MSHDAYTPAEDEALVRLLHKYGAEWKAHVREYSVLDGRAPNDCEKHVWYTNYYGLGGSLVEALTKITPAARAWPKANPKKPLFLDDPRADADHGSPGFRC